MSSRYFGAKPYICTQGSLAFWEVSDNVPPDSRAEEEKKEKQGIVS